VPVSQTHRKRGCSASNSELFRTVHARFIH
jgi:hypothetical protein